MREHHYIRRDAEFAAHGLAHGGIGTELVDIDAVGDNLRAAGVAQSQMRLEPGSRVGVTDPATRQQGAGLTTRRRPRP